MDKRKDNTRLQQLKTLEHWQFEQESLLEDDFILFFPTYGIAVQVNVDTTGV